MWSNGAYGERDPRRHYQRILNEEIPEVDFPNKPAQERINVMARLVWEHDGEQWMPAVATRWNRTHVLVSWTEPDPRKAASMAWLRVQDVQRR
jgi:hypothetical protein